MEKVNIAYVGIAVVVMAAVAAGAWYLLSNPGQAHATTTTTIGQQANQSAQDLAGFLNVSRMQDYNETSAANVSGSP